MGGAPGNDLNVGSRPLNPTFGPDWFALLGGSTPPILDLGNAFLDPSDPQTVQHLSPQRTSSLQSPDLQNLLRLSNTAGGQSVSQGLNTAIGNPPVFLGREETAGGSIESQLSQFWRNNQTSHARPQRCPLAQPSAVPPVPHRTGIDPNPQRGLRNDPISGSLLTGNRTLSRTSNTVEDSVSSFFSHVVQTLEVIIKDLDTLKSENEALKSQVGDLTVRLEAAEGRIKQQQQQKSLSPPQALPYSQTDESIMRNFEQHRVDIDSLWKKTPTEAGHLGMYFGDADADIPENENPIRNRVRALSDDITTQKRNQEVCDFHDGILLEEPHRMDHFHIRRGHEEQMALLGVPILREVAPGRPSGAHSPRGSGTSRYPDLASRLSTGASHRTGIPSQICCREGETWTEASIDQSAQGHPAVQQCAKDPGSTSSGPGQGSTMTSLPRHMPAPAGKAGLTTNNPPTIIGDYDRVHNFCLWQIGNISEIRGDRFSPADCIVSPPFDFKDVLGKLRIRLQPLPNKSNTGTQPPTSPDPSAGASTLRAVPGSSQDVGVTATEQSLQLQNAETQSAGQGSLISQQTSWLQDRFGLYMSISVTGPDCFVKLSLVAGDKVSDPQWHKFSKDPDSGSWPHATRLCTEGPWAGLSPFATYEECVDVSRDAIPLGVAIFDVIQATGSGQLGDPAADLTSAFHMSKDSDEAAVNVVRQLYRQLLKPSTLTNSDAQAPRVGNNRCYIETQGS